MAKRFRAVLEGVENGSGTAITIPFDVEKTFGKRGRVPVRGTINGVPYRGSIFRMGSKPYFMVVNRKLREAGNLSAGDVVSVVMERDDAPRTVEVPADLAAALAKKPAAAAAWEKLSFTHKKEWVEAVEGAKRAETRAARIARAVAELETRARK